jgi:antitoxin FitA
LAYLTIKTAALASRRAIRLKVWSTVLSFAIAGWRFGMDQPIVRGLDDRLIQALKLRAARAGRAAEAEHRAILEQAFQGETETFAEAAARLRARTPPLTTVSTDLIRRDRDRDHARANE